MRRAANLNPVKLSAPEVARLLSSDRITTVLEYCQAGEVMGAQVDKDREPFLLVEDYGNPGEFAKVAVYDCRIEAIEKRSGRCWIDVAAGELLVPANTVVYWR